MNLIPKLLRKICVQVEPCLQGIRAFLIGGAIVGLSHGGMLPAANQTWDGDTDGNWGTGTNWVGDPADVDVPDTGDTATFDSDGNGNIVIDLGTGVTSQAINNIIVDTANAAAYIFGNNTGNTGGNDTLQFDLNGDFTVNGTVTAIQTINADIVLGDGSGGTSIFTNNGSSNLILNGNITTGTGGGTGNYTLRFAGSGDTIWAGTATPGGASQYRVEARGTDVSVTGSTDGIQRFTLRNDGTLTYEIGSTSDNGLHDIQAGTLTVKSDQQFDDINFGGGNASTGGDANFVIDNGAVVTMGGTWDYFDDNNPNDPATNTDTSKAIISGSGSILLNGNRTFGVDKNNNVGFTGNEMTVNVDVAGDVAGGRNLTKADLGTLVFTGTMSQINQYVVQGGRLEIMNFGMDDDIILGNNANTGTLVYNGSGEAVNAATQFRIGDNQADAGDTGGAVLLNNGSGAITFSNAAANDPSENATVDRTFELGGTFDGAANVIAGALVDNNPGMANIGIIKSGASIWTLGGNNTYTGATAINAGTLNLNGSNTTDINVAAGATLGGGGSTTGSLTLADSAIIEINQPSGGFTASGGLDLTGVSDDGIIVNITEIAIGVFDIVNYGGIATGFTAGDGDAKFIINMEPAASARGAGTLNDNMTSITYDLGYANRTWNGNVSDDWDIATTNNWQEGDFQFQNGDAVFFDNTATGSAPRTVTITDPGGGTGTVAPFSVSFVAGSGEYIINADTNETLTVGAGGLNFLGENATDDVTINAEVIGSGTITKGVAGPNNADRGLTIFTFDNSNFDGVTNIFAGDLQIDHVNALGNDASNTITIDDNGDDGQLILNFNGVTMNNNIVASNVGGNKQIRFDNGGTTDARAVTLGGTITQSDVNSPLRFSTEGQRQDADIGGTTSGNVSNPTHILTVTGQITSSAPEADGQIEKLGQGVLVLNNDTNDFTGSLYVNQGTVYVSSIGNIDEASAAGAQRSAVPFGIRLGSGNNATIESVTGTLIYNGIGAESSDRQFRIGASGNTSTASNGGGILANNGGGALTFTAAEFINPENSNATRISARNLTLAGTFTGTNEIQGIISNNLTPADPDFTGFTDETISITVDTDGTWQLSGTSTYTGTTTVNGGTLLIDEEANIGNGNDDGGTAGTGLSAFVADQLTLNTGGTLRTSATFAIDDVHRGVTTNDGSIETDGSTVLTIDNVITGSTLNKEGTGTLEFNAANTFTGLNVNAGTARAVAATNAFGTNTAVTVTSTLDLNGTAQEIGSITGTGTVTNSNAGAGTLRIGSGDGDSTTSGTTFQDGTGTLALDKIGNGTVTLAADVTANHTGGTTISAGQLNIETTVNGAVTVEDGATLGGEGSSTGLLTLGTGTGSSPASLSVDGSTEPAAFTSVGLDTDTTNGQIEINFSAVPTGTGDITVLVYGTDADAGTFAGDFTIGTGLNLSGRGGMVNDTTTSITVSTGFANRTWDNGSTDNLWTEGAAGSLNWTDGDELFYNGDFITFNDNVGSDQNITLSDSNNEIAPNSVTFSNNSDNYAFTANGSETLSASGGISTTGMANVIFNHGIVDPSLGGTTAITHTGTGALTLGGANTFTGGVSLSNGNLNIDSSTALGTGTFDINSGTIDNTSGGDIVNANNNVQTWDGDFTYTGSTHSLDLGTGAVTLGANRTVTVDNNELRVGGVVSGAGFGITKQGLGTLTLTGANTFDGTIQVDAGTLRAETDASALGAGNIILNGGTLALAAAVNTTFGRDVSVIADSFITADVIPSNGTVPGRTMTMGNLSIGAHTLDFRHGGDASGNNDMVVVFQNTTITGDATFNVPNVDTGSTLRIGTIAGGTNSITKDGTGVLILDDPDNVYSGGTTLLRGTLRGQGANAFGTGDIVTTGGNGNMTLNLRNVDSAANNKIISDDNSTLTLAIQVNGSETFNIKEIEVTAGSPLTVSVNRTSTGSDGTHTLNSVGGINFLGNGTLNVNGGNNYDLIIDSTSGGITTVDGTVNINVTSADLTLIDIISGGANINFGGANTTDLGTEGRIFLNAQNTYTGNTSISHRSDFAGGAAIILGVDNPFNTMGDLTITSSTSTDFTTLDLNGFNLTVNALATTNDAQKTITNNGSSDSILTTGSNNGGGTFDGVIEDGTNNISLVKNGTGNLTLVGTNTYTEGTTVNGGTLTLGNTSGDTLADTGAITLNNAILDLGTNNDTVGAVTLTSGGISGTGGILTPTSLAAESGTISAIIAGTTGLTKTTGGTLSISSNSTYTGATTVSAGTLDLTGSLTSAITLDDGTTLSGEGSTTGLLTIGSSGSGMATVVIDVSTQTGAFTSTGLTTNVNANGITVNGTGSQVSGDLTVFNFGAGSFTGDLTDFQVGTGINIGTRLGAGDFSQVGNTIVLDTGILDRTWDNGFGDGLWNISSSTNWSGGQTFENLDVVLFNDANTGSNETVTLSNSDNPIVASSMTLDHNTGAASTKNFIFQAAGSETLQIDGTLTIDQASFAGSNNDDEFNLVISGTGSVFIGDNDNVADPSGNTVTFSGDNTFTGGVHLDEGRLVILHEDALGDGGTLTMSELQASNRDPNLHIVGDGFDIDNPIEIIQSGGTKTIRIDGNNNAVTLSGNILNNDDSIFDFALDADDPGTSITVTGLISGTGGVRAQDDGVVTLNNNANSFERGVFIEAGGTLEVTSIGNVGENSAAGAGTNGTAGIVLGNNTGNGTLVYTGAGDESTDRRVQIGDNNGGVGTRTGTGTIRNASTGTGSLTFTNAAFNVAQGTANTDRDITFETDSGDIIIDGAIVNNDDADGEIGIIKTGTAGLFLNGINTYTRATNINAGTLGGGGTINGAVTIAGTARHTAGTTSTADVQTINGLLTYDDGATVTWNLVSNVAGAVSGDQFDQFTLNTGGDLAFGGTINLELDFTGLNFNDGFWNSQLNEWLIWDTGALEVAPAFNITNNVNSDWDTGNLGIFELRAGSSFGAGDANGIWLVQTSVIPEPSTFALMGLGLAGFGWFIRRRKRPKSDAVMA